jgi:hypothetical protein
MRNQLISSQLPACLLLLVSTAMAQSAPSGTPAPGGQNSSNAPVPYASVSQLNVLLSEIEQAAQASTADLGKLRIEKWKMDSANKRQAQGDVDSVRRNLQAAMPELVNQLRSSPEDLTATFKLYRNLDALYDVFSSVVESAGAFGTRDDFQSLSNDLSSFERSRRSLAERMESLTTAKEAELTRLRTQVKALAAVPPPPPKKIVVDDDETPKKPVKKKAAPKTTKPATPPVSNTTSQPAPQTQPPAKPQ